MNLVNTWKNIECDSYEQMTLDGCISNDK